MIADAVASPLFRRRGGAKRRGGVVVREFYQGAAPNASL